MCDGLCTTKSTDEITQQAREIKEVIRATEASLTVNYAHMHNDLRYMLTTQL